MTPAQELKAYLKTSGESQRALSLRAGLNAKAVSDILNIPGLTPRHTTLVALTEATGRDFLILGKEPPRTYADLIANAQVKGDASLVSKLKWLCRNAGWTPELKVACKQDVIDFFDRNGPSSVNLTKGSFSTYRSALVKAVAGAQSRQRRRRIDDIGGMYGEAYKAIQASDLPTSSKVASGPFLVFLHDANIDPSSISTDTLAEYYRHRVDVSSKGEAGCKKHVCEISTLLCKLSAHADFSGFGFAVADHPFEDVRDKFGVNEALIAPLLAEFENRVAPWVTGKMSRDGLPRSEFIASLDALEAPVSDKKARLRNAKKDRLKKPGKSNRNTVPAVAADAGFLIGKDCWSASTLDRRRGYVKSMAKAIIAATEVVPETFEELTDPEFLEVGAEALADSNKGDYPSDYVASVLKSMRKIAAGYICRSSEDLKDIADLIKLHDTGISGIAPRNKAKLQQFTETRVTGTTRLSGSIITAVNDEVDRRRKAHKAKWGTLPAKIDVMDAELIRDAMAALAHNILMSRAPRSDNVLRARLDWISWHGDVARLTVPAAELKMRGKGDADLPILLSESTSRLLRKYLEDLRPRILKPGDKQNPYLFPSQGKEAIDTHYSTLLKRVTRLLAKHVGVQIHPHLYRHLIGWIWLKDCSDHLPKVQRLLGHKNLQTTLDYYAELDEDLLLDEWQEKLSEKSAANSSKRNIKGRFA